METPCLDFLGDAPGQHRVPAAVLAAREDRLALQPEALDRGGGGGGLVTRGSPRSRCR